jgi:putative addiction module CopG family antidote
MTITLVGDAEKIVKEAMETGRFRSADEVVREALQSLRESEFWSATQTAQGVRRDAVREMLDFVHKNSVRLEGVSVRDLIHEGHRL